jgi:opacity protein-like surface antigen
VLGFDGEKAIGLRRCAVRLRPAAVDSHALRSSVIGAEAGDETAMRRLIWSRPKTRACAAAGLAAWLTLASASAAPAAESPAAEEPDTGSASASAGSKHKIDFSVNGSYAYQFDADLDKGGDYSVQRANFQLSAASELTEVLRLSVSFGYNLNLYHFGGSTTFESEETTILLTDPDNQNPDGTLISTISVASSPWKDIHIYSFNAMLTTDLSNDLSIFGGPIFQIARETGADWSDSISGGGTVGATWHISDTLTIGGGIGVITELANPTKFFPVFVLDWQITDSLRLTNQTQSLVGKTVGIELIWNIAPKWELALGGAYEFRRFRLDDKDLAPRGVGEETVDSFWLRSGYRFNDHVSVDLYGGVSTSVALSINDSNGHRLASDNASLAPTAGASINIRF